MKKTRQPNRRAKKLQKRGGESADTSGVHKSMKSQEVKAANNAYAENGVKIIKCLANHNNPTEMPDKSAVLDLYPKQTFHPSTKIKLKLFPVNEETRMALEKDGYYPYLELTLRAGKKISTVLNHLISKWGRSSVARGELMLFPYSKPSGLTTGLRWTLNDCDISAENVYAAVGRPSIFRLRYGWVSISIPFKTHSASEGLEKDCKSTAQNMSGDGKKSEEMMYELKSSSMNDINITVASEKIVDFPNNPMDNEPTIGSGLEQSSKSALLNIDSLTNISIGGFLSEASLLGKCSNWDSKLTGSNTSVQPARPITDSLDACIAAQINFQIPKQTNNDQHSSILDAEETCHAFPLKKLSSSSKDFLSLDTSAGGIFQEGGTESLNFPKASQVHNRSELPEDVASTESKTDMAFSLRDESSLGLSGINWSESLGPFDLGLPVSRKVSTGEDSISLSGFSR